MKTLFSSAELALLPQPDPLIPLCGQCGLYKHCRSPKMAVAGKGKRGILVVGEAPGRDEDIRGKPFVGATGQRLQDTARRYGVEIFEDCWLTNALICRPGEDNVIKDVKSIGYCRPNLLRAIRDLKPSTIILLGGSAVDSLINYLIKGEGSGRGAKKKSGLMQKWNGWQIPYQRYNAWICPTYHPSYVERQERERDNVPGILFERQLRAALVLEGRPWKKVPDYRRDVRCEMDVDKAAEIIRGFVKAKRIAFDYETTCLKPYGPHAEIVCCSISDGKTTVAYPWHGRAVKETVRLLTNPDIGKIASNIKFEDTWSTEVGGFRVRGWELVKGWDTMNAAHAIDTRSGITSIKFQAFVLLGQSDYSSHIDQYKKSKGRGGNAPNRIKELDLRTLLLYNGLDSLLEYKVAEIQMAQVGV